MKFDLKDSLILFLLISYLQKIAQASTIGVTISPNLQFSKRYLKYLTKKFLKKYQLRDWLRVVASGKGGYELKYYNIDAAEEAEEE